MQVPKKKKVMRRREIPGVKAMKKNRRKHSVVRDARRQMKKRKRRQMRKMTTQTLGVSANVVAMFEDIDKRFAQGSEYSYDSDGERKEDPETKKFKSLRENALDPPTTASEHFVHPMLRKPQKTSETTKRTRASSRPWETVPNTFPHVQRTTVTDATGSGLDDDGLDWGDEPCPEAPAGRVPNYHVALSKFVTQRLAEDSARPSTRRIDRTGVGINAKLKAAVALRKAAEQLGLQIPPELVAFQTACRTDLHRLASEVLKMSNRVHKSSSSTNAEREEVFEISRAFLDLYFDFNAMGKAVSKAMAGAALQMQCISYNLALVPNPKGIPSRMPRPPKGQRPLCEWMNVGVYDTPREDQPICPPGLANSGRRLATAMMGRQFPEDKARVDEDEENPKNKKTKRIRPGTKERPLKSGSITR
jgi:hypothetical protein